MEYLPAYNLLLEALAYFGRRAAGHTTQQLLTRLERRGATQLSALEQRLEPLGSLMERLNQEIPIPEAELQSLFGNLAGFSFNTIGSCCPAFLLFYPEIFSFVGELDPILDKLRRLSAEQLAGHLAISLELTDESQPGDGMGSDEFTTQVLALSIPAESKVAILDLFHQPKPVIEQAAGYLNQAIALLRKNQAVLDTLCAPFSAELKETGVEGFLTRTSSLQCSPELSYEVHPFVFGMDTNLAVTVLSESEDVQMYCGILRRALQEALSTCRGAEEDVYQAIKLLGDRTRFDILCYLRNREAYGQELAAQFGLSRNTIHHHMSKLLAARLVKCKVDGNRVYYTIDRDSISDLLNHQRALLLPREFEPSTGNLPQD